MKDLLEVALKKFETESAIVWSGSGPAVQKTVSCAEILKRKYPVYQINRLCFRKVEEHWDPQLEGLDPIVVNREIPVIHILLSKSPLDNKELGYQTTIKGASQGSNIHRSAEGPKRNVEGRGMSPKRKKNIAKRAQAFKAYTSRE